MRDTLVLEPVLDLKAAAPLKAALMQRCGGGPLEIDASAVQTLGGLCLQVLLSARRTWAGEGHPLIVAQRSESFDAALRLFDASERLEGAVAEGEAG